MKKMECFFGIEFHGNCFWKKSLGESGGVGHALKQSGKKFWEFFLEGFDLKVRFSRPFPLKKVEYFPLFLLLPV